MKKMLGVTLLLILLIALFSISLGHKKKYLSKDNIFKTAIKKIDVMVLENYDNNLYVGTTKGLFILSGEENNFKMDAVKLKKELTFIRSIFKDRNNNIWVGGIEGVIRISEDGNQTIYNKESGYLPDDRVNSIMETSQGNLWIGTWGGAIEIDIDGNANIYSKKLGLLVDMVNVIIEDETKGIIFASYNVRGGGISYLKNHKFSYYTDKNGLININTTAIIGGGDGSYWVGSGMFESGGITIFEPQGEALKVIKTYKIEDGLAGEKVRSLKKIGDALFIGSEYDGLALWKDNGERRIFTIDNGLSNNEAKCFALLGDLVFVGTKAGLCYVNIKEL